MASFVLGCAADTAAVPAYTFTITGRMDALLRFSSKMLDNYFNFF